MARKLYNHYKDHISQFKGTMYDGQWPTIGEMFSITAKLYPQNECFKAFTPEYLCFTYAEAEKKIHEVACFLLENGAKPGDHIAVTGKNSPEWGIAYLAITMAGCVIVPLDYSLHTEDAEKLLKFGDVKMLFCDSEKINAIDPEGKFIEKRFSLEPKGNDNPYILTLVGKERELPRMKEEDTAAILFTSGTTGTPKGVMLSHRNFVSDTFNAQHYFDVFPNDVFYAILPIHHAYTMTAVFLETISSGACCVFGKKLVTPIMLKELKEGKITMLLAVPMLFNKLLAGLMNGVEKQGKFKAGLIHFLMGLSGIVKKLTGYNMGKKLFKNMLLSKISLDNIRACICGGGPLPASTFRQFNQLGVDFVQGYGLTETAPITHLNPIEGYVEESVGKLFVEMEQKIVDPDSEGNGVVYLKGPQVMQGYYKNPEATAEVLSEDGWFNTGDVGHLDEYGYLYLTGRAKNIIVTEGGKNVFPEEIEDKFQLYDEIDQVCIVPYIKDKALKSEGIRLIVHPTDAFIKKEGLENASKRMQAIVDEVNRDLQSYKKITLTTVTDEALAMTSTKKVKRFEVIKKYKLD